MEFDINNVYTAINAAHVAVGSKVLFSNDLMRLKSMVKNGTPYTLLDKVEDEGWERRFVAEDGEHFSFVYCPPEEPKWKTLNVGAVVWIAGRHYLVTGKDDVENAKNHICVNGDWLPDTKLENCVVVYNPAYPKGE